MVVLVSCRRHARGRLVEQQQARMLDQAHGQLHAPLVAAAQGAGMGEAALVQADILEDGFGLVADFALGVESGLRMLIRKAPSRLAKAGAMTFCSTRQLGEDLRRLEHADHAHLVDLVRLLAGQHLAVEDHGPAAGRDAADDDVEQGRLAGAVGADDGVRLAFLDLQVDVGERMQAAEVLVHVGDVEDDVLSLLSHRLTPPAGRARPHPGRACCYGGTACRYGARPP